MKTPRRVEGHVGDEPAFRVETEQGSLPRGVDDADNAGFAPANVAGRRMVQRETILKCGPDDAEAEVARPVCVGLRTRHDTALGPCRLAIVADFEQDLAGAAGNDPNLARSLVRSGPPRFKCSPHAIVIRRAAHRAGGGIVECRGTGQFEGSRVQPQRTAMGHNRPFDDCARGLFGW